MAEPSRTNHELIEENSFLKQRIQELEHSEAERKQVEEGLRESEERFRLIVGKTADLISVLDMNLRFTYISQATMRLRGFSVEEAMRQTLDQVLTLESMRIGRTVFEEEMQREASGNADLDRTRILELEEYKKDGSIICVEVSLSFLRDKDGHPVEILMVSRDITERKRAEEALKLSHERLVDAQKIARIGNWEADLSTDELYWSQVIFDIFGFDSKSFKPSVKAFHNAVHPDDKSIVLESEKRSEQTGLHDVVHRIIRPNGEVRFVHELAKRYTDDNGKLVKLRGTVQDITERGQAEEKIRQGNILLDSIIENIPNTIFLKDAKELRFTLFNSAGEELTGYSRDDLMGKNDYDFVPKEQADFFMEKDREVLCGKGVVDIPEETLQTHNKGVRTLHTKKVPILNAKGEPEYLLGISEDITDRKRAEEALAEEHIRLQQALDEIRTLRGILPICSYCKKIRNDEGYWDHVETYVSAHTDAKFSHGICPTCFDREMKGLKE